MDSSARRLLEETDPEEIAEYLVERLNGSLIAVHRLGAGLADSRASTGNGVSYAIINHTDHPIKVLTRILPQ